MAKSVEIVAVSVEEAIARALEDLSASLEEVVVDILEEPTAGGRPARVLVTLEDGQTVVYGAAEEAAAKDEEQLQAVVQEFLHEILSRFNLPVQHLELERPSKDSLEVRLDSKNCAILIGRGGDTLAALNYLLSTLVNQLTDEKIHVHLDIGGYRRKQEERLQAVARRTATKVVKLGKEFEMNPMSPADRRIIHSALQNFRGVTTYSEGEGRQRRVIIAPTKQR